VGHEELSSRWVGAGHLQIGDKVKQADGTTGTVTNVFTLQQTQEMFDLTVDTAHTFYVGRDGWLVHNCGDELANLLDKEASEHVLGGSVKIGKNGKPSYSGGHRAGTGFPDKSEFPSEWSDAKILDAISGALTDPKARWAMQDHGNWLITRWVGGVKVQTVLDSRAGRIVSGFPSNLPRNK
jgi:Bacterial EndoU nuclease/Pretoxin HINT domain